MADDQILVAHYRGAEASHQILVADDQILVAHYHGTLASHQNLVGDPHFLVVGDQKVVSRCGAASADVREDLWDYVRVPRVQNSLKH